MNFLEISELLELFRTEEIFSEQVFDELVTKRPKLAIRCLKRYTGRPLKELSVVHVFVNNIHDLRFTTKINLLMKLITSLSQFNGTLEEAKQLTDILLRNGCDFSLGLPKKMEAYEKLFFHNIAINLVSIDDQIQWQFKYLWFLTKKPGFQRLVFSELQDYWSGEALSRLKRINSNMKPTEEKCRKFVIILLISGNFYNFKTKLNPNSLELLDRHSLLLLYYFGFNFNDCLKTYLKIEDEIEESDEELISKTPKLMKFLLEVEYFRKPMKLKHQIRVYFREREGRQLNQFAKDLNKSGLVSKPISDYLRYKHFVRF